MTRQADRDTREDEQRAETVGGGQRGDPSRTLSRCPRRKRREQRGDLRDFRQERRADRQFYMNWIQGRPFVRDFNPHRQVSRAKGDAGKTDATGLYQTANGWDAYAPSAVDSSFLTGAQDINARRYLDK